MSDQGSKRPESFEDLPDYVREHMVLRLDLSDEVFGSGLLSVVDAFVVSLRSVYPDLVVTKVDGQRLIVDRKASEVELAAALARHQKYWDQAHPGQAPSTEAGA